MHTNPTPAEAVLWSWLRRRQLNGFKFRRQHIIAGFIVDFYCPALQLAVEVDGPIHRYQPRQDEHRTQILQARGVKIIRFTSDDVMHHVDQVILALRRVVLNPQHICFLG